MSRFLVRFVPLLASVALASPTLADLATGTGLLQLNLGTAIANSQETGRSIDGPAVVLAGDFVGASGKGTFGVSLSMFSQDEDRLRGSDAVKATIRTVPVLFQAKAWAGGLQGRFAGFVGAGVGVYWSDLDTVIQTTPIPVAITERTSSVVAAFPAGAMLYVGDRFVINATYQLYWFDRSFYDGNVAHLGTLGLGFVVGD